MCMGECALVCAIHLAPFSKLGSNMFRTYLHHTMSEFNSDNFAISSIIQILNTPNILRNVLMSVMIVGLSINTIKSIVLVPLGELVGHLVSKR